MNLVNLTSDELNLIDKANTFVLIPLASVEQHGPHLPLGTKGFLSETIACIAADKLNNEGYNCLVAPTVQFMPCQSSFGFPGIFSMTPRTYSDALYEICSSFHKEGFRCIFFVNLSVSPDALKAIETTIEDLSIFPDFGVFDPMPLWNFSYDEKLDEFLKTMNLDIKNEIHGDIKDTSALLALDPTLVKSEIISQLNSCKVNTGWELLKGNISFKEMGSELGYLGSPAFADKEFGNLYLNTASNALAESMKFVSQGNKLPELPLKIKLLLKYIDLDDI